MVADWFDNQTRVKSRKNQFACEAERPSSVDGVVAPRAATDGEQPGSLDWLMSRPTSEWER